MSQPSKPPQENPEVLHSPLKPLLWILLPLVVVIVWGLFNRT